MNFRYIFFFLITVLTISCNLKQQADETTGELKKVTATAETDPMPTSGDAADDPAIWIHPSDPLKSLIVGTNKKSGLSVYNLNGKLLKHHEVGRINNVDIRQGIPLGGRMADIVAGSNRSDNTILVMSIDSNGLLSPVLNKPIQPAMAEVYGFCLYHDRKENRLFAFVNGKCGKVEQWELTSGLNGKINGNKVRSFQVEGQPEGCVADDELGYLYVGEEDRGLWKFSASAHDSTKGTLIDSVGYGRLVADVEGVTIWYGTDGKGFLIVSSQGNHTFAVYQREGSNRYIGSFGIADSPDVDGVAETDGIDVTSIHLGNE